MGVCDDEDEDEGGVDAHIFHEKGGKELRIRCHRRLREPLAPYIAAASLDPKAGTAVPELCRPWARAGSMRPFDVLAIVKKTMRGGCPALANF